MIVDASLAPVDSREAISTLRLSVAGGLSQFGVHLERLPAGARASFRHWPETEDELVLMDNTETLLTPGDMVCWPASRPIGHQLDNRSAGDVVFLTIGTRLPRDTIHYPDHDLITHKDGAARHFAYANGSSRSAGDRK